MTRLTCSNKQTTTTTNKKTATTTTTNETRLVIVNNYILLSVIVVKQSKLTDRTAKPTELSFKLDLGRESEAKTKMNARQQVVH